MFIMAVAAMELFSHLSNSVKIKLFMFSVTNEESASPKEGLQEEEVQHWSPVSEFLPLSPPLPCIPKERRSLGRFSSGEDWVCSRSRFNQHASGKPSASCRPAEDDRVCSVTLWATAGASA